MVTGFLGFPPEPGLPSVRLIPELELDRRPKAFFILEAAVEVRDLCIEGEDELEFDADGDGDGDRSEELEGM